MQGNIDFDNGGTRDLEAPLFRKEIIIIILEAGFVFILSFLLFLLLTTNYHSAFSGFWDNFLSVH